jgi:2-dehydro-3-deoxyphosphogluconate aldolase/(4S)-4-hydroxy-2-oxoglutarate aldolase
MPYEAPLPHELLKTFRAAQVIPVVRTHTAKSATTAVAWLRDSGLRIFEITMTVPDAVALIRDLASDPTLLVGAGTVPNAETADVCLAAGAKFIVAPWVDPELSAP